MSEIHRVIVQIRAQSENGRDPGQVTFGYYTIAGDVLTMTDGEGRLVRSPYGDLYTHQLEKDEDPRVIAGRLTRRIRTNNVTGSDFNRRLDYPKGLCPL